MTVLRDYQVDFVKNLSIAVAEHKSVLGQSPGGTGKTKTFLHICKSAMNRGRAAIIITERKKIFDQIHNEAGGCPINADTRHVRIMPGRMYVAMAQSLVNRPAIIAQINSLQLQPIIIVDEAHISTSVRLLDLLTNRLLLGFTATPHYRWAKHLPVQYKALVQTQPVSWFIENGYLCDYQHIIKRKPGLKALQKRAREYTEESQQRFFGSEEQYRDLYSDLRKYTYKKCMLFCSSIDSAEDCFRRLVDEGFCCSIAHSKRSDERYQVGRFSELDQTDILVSVGSLTTGYDNPEVDLIVLYRATTSLPLYLQICFRGNRPKPGMFFRVLDYGGNGDRHKPYWYEHDWSLLWKEHKAKKDSVIPMKLCPKCESMLPTFTTICPYCGEIIPGKEPEKTAGLSVDLTAEYSKLRGRPADSLTPTELATYSKQTGKKKFAMFIAKQREHNTPGYLRDFGKAMGYKDNWAYIMKDSLPEPTKINFTI